LEDFMAWQVIRPGRKGVYIKYFDKNTYREEWIPREKTKHLDGKPQESVTAWIDKWEAAHGGSRERAQRIHLSDGDTLTGLWREYQSHRAKTRKRRSSTAETETAIFERHIVPFFVGKHKNKRPASWHDLVPGFHSYLFEKGYGDRTIQKTLWVLERFGRHLVFQRHMHFPFAVQVPARENQKITPLKSRKTPREVLQAAKNARETYSGVDLALLALLGYFAALRPSEAFALDKADLLTGALAEESTRTLSGFRAAGLGTRLSVSVTKTLAGSEPKEMTKTETSRGVVNVWDPDAAKAIAARVKDRPPGRLFPYSYDWLMKSWAGNIQPRLGLTLHDLRRASGLYLGREKRIPPTLLQEHMRHAELETTMLYCREPSVPEKRPKRVTQDFDEIL
jgi:integrase